MPQQGRRIEIRGVVQGVGFRPWVYQLARRHRVTGTVWNDAAGVVVDAFASDGTLDCFTAELESDTPPAARIRELSWSQIPYRDVAQFSIASSDTAGSHNISIPPDLATCDLCLSEVLDPTNRRHRYPFTNCTNCGPRYSIVKRIPYDRASTTMAQFTMCAECRREYGDPADRRFHAQPNACPACGPKLLTYAPDGTQIGSADAVQFAARAIRAQLIVAVKGLGGFHLACDATSETAVRRLRDRKRRDVKPLAVMVRDIEEAASIAELGEAERSLLLSVERPVVLVTRRPQSQIAPSVCGENPLIGLFLPYTPLHHLLLRDAGRPLVMTSGNVAEEPMVYRNEDALTGLGHIADVFLMHDREIDARVDDSVARVIAGAPVIFRRARGYVPRPIELRTELPEPVLAVGAHLKNTFCLAGGRSAYLGPHVGDLETVETLRSFESSIEKMKEFVNLRPSVIAHDLHPEYFSTRYALAQEGMRTIAVQHHHAHIVSAMAEHGLEETCVGVAYDGTGFGTDGTSWGGEILLADAFDYTRFATFRPIRLAGGDQAVRQVWRIALAVLDDAYDGAPPVNAIDLFRDVPRRAFDAVRRMIASGVNAPPARGVGRLFDALGAIGLGMPTARYEGEVAFRWNVIADPDEKGRYEVVVRDGATPWEIDFRPAIKSAVDELLAGASPAGVSARFHNTLAAVTAEVVHAATTFLGGAPVVLSGGCFQNARLTESVIGALGNQRVFMNRMTPPGDGGIALGQALIAAAALRRGCASREEEQTGVPACV